MPKNYLLTICFALLSLSAAAQKKNKTKSSDEVPGIISDSSVLLREVAQQACTCIDSLETGGKSGQEMVDGVHGCINKQVMSYQLMMKMTATFKNIQKENTINIAPEGSTEYKRYYYEIERYLSDSCPALQNKVAINNRESEFSMTKDKDALAAYEKGTDFVERGDYASAAPFFKKAVELDPKFAFAWDNLGVCYRRTERYDEAIAAYKKSLEIDPKGETPLHNLPVVYELKKDYKQALTEYEKIAKIYPDDPEIFYGIGRIYTFYNTDMEKSLENMCKAYNLYVAQKSPYRTDAEKIISLIYGQMKKDGKEKKFREILERNNIDPGK